MIRFSEKNILKFIKYSPIVFIFFLSILITNLLVIENKNRLIKEVSNLEMQYIKSQKSLVNKEVSRVYDYILYQKKMSETNLKQNLKQRIYEAHSIALNIYNENKDKDKNVILKMVQDALRDIRFNEGRGYYFMHNVKGQNVLYPLDRSVEGNDYSQLKDINGYFFVKKIIETIKNKTETFDTYFWSKPINEGQRIFKKVVFYKYFEPLNISIGTGEYIKDYEQSLQKNILLYISNITYGENGYIFVIDEQNKALAYPNKNFNDDISIEIPDLIKKGSTYKQYTSKDIHNKDIEKTSFLQTFSAWHWILGSGFNKDKLNQMITKKEKELNTYHNEYLTNIYIIIFFVTFVLLLTSIYLSKIIQEKFYRYNNKIYKEIDKNRQKDALLAQQSKMAAMGEMIGNIAHQWRQPLSLISTASTSLKLKQDFDMLEKDEVIRTSELITKTTLHLSQTIDDFRDFFKPNKEKTKSNTKELWDKTYNLIKEQHKIHNIEVIIDIEYKEIYLLINELMQVMINILNNAKDQFVKNKKNFIFILIRKDEDELMISIKDNAGGIPEALITRIFEPYFTTKHQSRGTGIGLYMSEEIIQKHMNGTIEVVNDTYTYKGDEYKGANFIITIPMKLEQQVDKKVS